MVPHSYRSRPVSSLRTGAKQSAANHHDGVAQRDTGQHGGARGPLAGGARRTRPTTRVRSRNRPAAVPPDNNLRQRPDMDPNATRGFRAAIVGLDTFAQRKPQLAAQLTVFEIDQPHTLAWKRQRLRELGYPIPDWLRLVPVDVEAGQSWWDELLATGSTLAMTFVLPIERVDAAGRPGSRASRTGAQQSGTFVYQLLYPAGDAGAGPRGWFPQCPPRVRKSAGRTLFRQPTRRTSPVNRRSC